MKKSKTRKVGTKVESKKVGTVRESEANIPLKIYPSMGAISTATGIPLSEIKQAKKDGCPGFVSTRVELLPLIRWIFRPTEDDEQIGSWSEELCRVKTLRERIRLAEDEGRVMDFANVVTGLQSVMSILFGRLDRMANQLPPALKGLDELAIMRKIEAETEELRKDIKAKFSETTKEAK